MSQDPACDEREWVDPDNYDKNFSKQWTTQAMREAHRIEGLPDPVPGPAVMHASSGIIARSPAFYEIGEAGHFAQEWGELIAASGFGSHTAGTCKIS